ncbi:hypothetical protein [Brevundimonas sp. TWP2-3-2]|uniref:hypothetical protein n=1 Tax=unclassified Brevundimonas TaxID=2622653 RepID=UPI003CE78EAA
MPATEAETVRAATLAYLPLTASRILAIGQQAASERPYRARNPLVDWISVPGGRETLSQANVTAGLWGSIDATRQEVPFDAVTLGDLNTFADPGDLLASALERSAPGAVCLAYVPNPAHWPRIERLIRGQDTDANETPPVLTLSAALTLFEKAGWHVLDSKAVSRRPAEGTALQHLLQATAALGIGADDARARLEPMGWVVRATRSPPPSTIALAAIGLKNFAGVTDARIDHPWTALTSLPGVRAAWGENTVVLPKGPPGVLTLHRQFMDGSELIQAVDRLIGSGWTIVSDMDDDPHHWPAFVESDFRAYRAVHAVTVTTETLADMIRQWNPNVRVFPNAILALPDAPASTPKTGNRLRLFFGALNRIDDWTPVMPGIREAFERLGDRIEIDVVHDRAFAEALPRGSRIRFRPTLSHPDYMSVLAGCDISLLPLADTAFNRLKSDIKLIESCAAGAVPICSPVVYDEIDRHGEVAIFAGTADEWQDAIIDLCANSDKVRQRRERGRDYVLSTRMHAQQAPEREAWSRSIMANRADLERQRVERLGAINT